MDVACQTEKAELCDAECQTTVNNKRKSLTSNQYNVMKVDSVKTVDHLCEFSGGGDIYINEHDLSPLIVFVLTESAAGNQDSQVTDDAPEGSATQSSTVSPLASGSSKLLSLCIEGKSLFWYGST